MRYKIIIINCMFIYGYFLSSLQIRFLPDVIFPVQLNYFMIAVRVLTGKLHSVGKYEIILRLPVMGTLDRVERSGVWELGWKELSNSKENHGKGHLVWMEPLDEISHVMDQAGSTELQCLVQYMDWRKRVGLSDVDAQRGSRRTFKDTQIWILARIISLWCSRISNGLSIRHHLLA